MSLFDVNATNCRQMSLVDAVSLPDQRVLNVVDLVASYRLHVTRERSLATGKQRRQPELSHVSRHTSVSFSMRRTKWRKLQNTRHALAGLTLAKAC